MPKDDRWFVDFIKLKTYLANNYQPDFFKYYDAIDTKPKAKIFEVRAAVKKRIHQKLVGSGYELITKPLKYIRQPNMPQPFTTKGDMDIEITLGIVDSLDNLDRVILVSGDSDYLPLVKRIHNTGKSVIIISFDKLLSWELRTFAINNDRCDFRVIENLRSQVEYIKS